MLALRSENSILNLKCNGPKPLEAHFILILTQLPCLQNTDFQWVADKETSGPFHEVRKGFQVKAAATMSLKKYHEKELKSGQAGNQEMGWGNEVVGGGGDLVHVTRS